MLSLFPPEEFTLAQLAHPAPSVARDRFVMQMSNFLASVPPVAPVDSIVSRWGNINRHKSKTVQDAIECVRRIDIGYLRVDALFVVQDDEDEKASETARMAAIYRDADVTITAALAPDEAEGFLHERACILAADDAGDAVPYLLFCCGDGPTILALSGYSSSPIPSPATPSCGADGPFRRARRPALLGSAAQPALKEDDWEREWEQIVEECSSRALSFSGDKLPALSAVASTFSAWCLGSYVAGVRVPWLVRLLLWRSPAQDQAVRMKDIAPSWSWESLSGSVAFVTQDFTLYHDRRNGNFSIPDSPWRVLTEQIEIMTCD
ncbi:uncharacterized protein B0H64DRAFT_377849 [Chaetomium fimeti]|uniref:Heterokaryon incompatibility domain-containing protein n=1 Tax=Chaetomium fimeti TaxID=1854472 RepID=A0AAE0LNK4_9PEZI|nr:hypothetical protein B0H64DRAFT_377849 [Chaetomium fimeti]